MSKNGFFYVFLLVIDVSPQLDIILKLCSIKCTYVLDGETLTTRQFFECSEVEFGDIPNDIIKDYAATIEPL